MVKKVVKKQKQKQKQTQNVKQTVIIRLDKEGKRIMKKRKRPRKQPSDGVSSMERALPPPVIYQGSYPVQINPPPTPNLPLQAAPTIRNIAPPQTEMQDVGVGTEGFVTILDVPTKREQLENLITPVSKEEPSFQYDYPVKPIPSDFFSKKIAELRAMKEPMTPPPPPPPPKTRRNKKEMEEARTMEREDIASINLGLSQFEPSFKKPQISKDLPKETTESIKKEPNIPEAFTPLFAESSLGKPLNKMGKPIESLMTEPNIAEEQNIPEIQQQERIKRKTAQTWKYWRGQYREKTNQDISLKEAKDKGSLDEFIAFVNRIK